MSRVYTSGHSLPFASFWYSEQLRNLFLSTQRQRMGGDVDARRTDVNLTRGLTPHVVGISRGWPIGRELSGNKRLGSTR